VQGIPKRADRTQRAHRWSPGQEYLVVGGSIVKEACECIVKVGSGSKQIVEGGDIKRLGNKMYQLQRQLVKCGVARHRGRASSVSDE